VLPRRSIRQVAMEGPDIKGLLQRHLDTIGGQVELQALGRRAQVASQESSRTLAARDGLNPKTVRKWRGRKAANPSASQRRQRRASANEFSGRNEQPSSGRIWAQKRNRSSSRSSTRSRSAS
jgi:hypothetical protein